MKRNAQVIKTKLLIEDLKNDLKLFRDLKNQLKQFKKISDLCFERKMFGDLPFYYISYSFLVPNISENIWSAKIARVGFTTDEKAKRVFELFCSLSDNYPRGKCHGTQLLSKF